MTTKELQTELETRARNIKERAKGAAWGEKEVAFFREVYRHTVEHEKRLKEKEILLQKLSKLHELTTLYSHAFTLLSGSKDLPIRTDSPTPIGTLVLMRLTSLAPDTTEIQTLKTFINNAFNPSRFSPATSYGTFEPRKYREANRMANVTYHAENEG